ncbi:MAG: phytanoyl-CoA dioxygenase family protein [Acidimicrobiales bacterium]
MNPAQTIGQAEVEQFWRDGVVCLRGVIDPEWISELTAGVNQNIAAPSDRGRLWNRDEQGCTTFYDSQVWNEIEQYRRFVLESPMAELAGRLMEAEAVNFFFDAIFVRSAGSQFRTPFHQDEPYWSVEGFDTCSSWMPLVPVQQKSALEFVRGSHRWDVKYSQVNFGGLTGDERDQVAFDDGLEPFPDIEGRRSEFDIVSWDMEPGDVAIFNARTIHGGSGNLEPDRELKVFNTQWLGDDVRVRFRPEGMDPDHSEVMKSVGLNEGDRLGTSLYPEVWRRDLSGVSSPIPVPVS